MIGKNNVFNIRYSKSNNWKGQIGQTRGFVDFDSVEHCVRAAIILMRNYRNHGFYTVGSIIGRFAPSVENNTFEYIRYVSNIIGLPSDVVLSNRLSYACLLSAMSVVENGYNGRLSADYILNCMNKFKIFIV